MLVPSLVEGVLPSVLDLCATVYCEFVLKLRTSCQDFCQSDAVDQTMSIIQQSRQLQFSRRIVGSRTLLPPVNMQLGVDRRLLSDEI